MAMAMAGALAPTLAWLLRQCAAYATQAAAATSAAIVEASFSCSHFLQRLIFCKRVPDDRDVSIVAELASPSGSYQSATHLQNVNLNLAPPALLHLADRKSTTCFSGHLGCLGFQRLFLCSVVLACLLA